MSRKNINFVEFEISYAKGADIGWYTEMESKGTRNGNND